MAVGCHKLLPIPTNMAQASSTQYVEVNPIKKYGKPTQNSDMAINWPFLPQMSTSIPPGMLEIAPAAY